MSTRKISQLTPLTTALNGTEALEIARDDISYQITSINLFKVIGILPNDSPAPLSAYRIPIFKVSDGTAHSCPADNIAVLHGDMPGGGTTGQVLVKLSGVDYDTGWADDPGAPQAANLVFAGPTGGAAADPTFRSIVNADISGAGAALTKADDTNVTLTLGGSHATALVNAASLTLGWSGQLSVARGGTGVATSTGTGSVVLSVSPSLTTPILGTPTSGTMTNCTGLPIGTGVSGLGAGVTTFLATPSSANLISAVTDETGTGALVFATSPTLVTPALGTPASGTLTNCTGLPVLTGISGFGAGIATFLGTPSSANLQAAVTGETGSGALVFATSPALVTPDIGAATGTSLVAAGILTARSATATPAAASAVAGFTMGSAGVGFYWGTGDPNTALTAAKGSYYSRTDGSSSSTRLYVNTDSSTAWTNVTTAT